MKNFQDGLHLNIIKISHELVGSTLDDTNILTAQ